MPLEARLFQAAAGAGVPVPELVASGDAAPDALETGYLVMHLVDGETIARKILRDEPYAHARTVLVRQLGEAIAKLHAVPVDSVEGLGVSDPLVRYREVLDGLQYPSPTFELAFRWLEKNRPAMGRTAIVHGDFRLGNVIVNSDGLAAVLDWELAHIGDPMEDLGWLSVRAWRFGGSGTVAGLGSLADLFDGYRNAGGTVDEVAVHWWIVAGTLMWGVMCALQASAHTSGSTRSVELAAIGRRVAEQEHDLLDLLGAPPVVHEEVVPGVVTAPSNAAGSTVADSTSVFGVPDAATLLDAVRGFLEHDVMAATMGRVNFHARVASNVLATLQREIDRGPHARDRIAAAQGRLGIAPNVDVDTAERLLTDSVRRGEFDQRSDELLAELRLIVTERLAIANPKHLRA